MLFARSLSNTKQSSEVFAFFSLVGRIVGLKEYLQKWSLNNMQQS